MKIDYLNELRKGQRAYRVAELNTISTTPTLAEVDEENYSDSYKWLRVPIPDEQPETVLDMILSGVEDFPNDCLAGVLVAVLKNRVPNKILLSSIGIDRVGSSFHFCISGSTSLEDLRTLCAQYRLTHCLEDGR